VFWFLAPFAGSDGAFQRLDVGFHTSFFMTFLRSLYPSQRVKKLARPEFPLPILLVCCLVVVETGNDLLAGSHPRAASANACIHTIIPSWANAYMRLILRPYHNTHTYSHKPITISEQHPREAAS